MELQTMNATDDQDQVQRLRDVLGDHLCRSLGVYGFPDEFLLTVVIPVFNEQRTIESVVERIRACGVPHEIVIVDDGSTDGTRDILDGWRDQENLRVILHEKNQGKGAALKTGFAEARGDAVIVQDADLEYDPAEYRILLQPIVEGEADAVFGSRFSGDCQRVLYFWHYLGNRFLTTLSNCFTNLNLTDMETCYKVFRREVLEQITPTLRERGFGVEPELTAKLASIPGVRVYERPVSYHGRTYAQGKKITWRDGLRALWCIVRYGRGLGGKARPLGVQENE